MSTEEVEGEGLGQNDLVAVNISVFTLTCRFLTPIFPGEGRLWATRTQGGVSAVAAAN